MTLTHCIARDCGIEFDSSIPETRENLRSFWQRYCPECRTKGNAGTPAIVNIPANKTRPEEEN
jgi:predicted Zn-dependent protease